MKRMGCIHVPPPLSILALDFTYGEFPLRQIIFSGHMIYAYGMGRSPILILGSGIYILVSIFKNIIDCRRCHGTGILRNCASYHRREE